MTQIHYFPALSLRRRNRCIY